MSEVPRTPRLSFHARTRCAEMGVPTKEAKRAVQFPETLGPGRDGCRVAVKGRLAVVYHPARMEIVTVLWARAEGRDQGPIMFQLAAGL